MSPGVNPLKDVEALGKKLGYTGAHKNFHNVSLGQGQEVVAEAAMATAAKGINYSVSKSIKTHTIDYLRNLKQFKISFLIFRGALGDIAKYPSCEDLVATTRKGDRKLYRKFGQKLQVSREIYIVKNNF